MVLAHDLTSITISATLYPVVDTYNRFQNRLITGDGGAKVFDRGTEIQFLELQFRETHDKIKLIRDFVRNDVVFALHAFALTPEPDQDIGNGDGNGIYVRYWSDNFSYTQGFYHNYIYSMTLKKEAGLAWGSGVEYTDDIDDFHEIEFGA